MVVTLNKMKRQDVNNIINRKCLDAKRKIKKNNIWTKHFKLHWQLYEMSKIIKLFQFIKLGYCFHVQKQFSCLVIRLATYIWKNQKITSDFVFQLSIFRKVDNIKQYLLVTALSSKMGEHTSSHVCRMEKRKFQHFSPEMLTWAKFLTWAKMLSWAAQVRSHVKAAHVVFNMQIRWFLRWAMAAHLSFSPNLHVKIHMWSHLSSTLLSHLSITCANGEQHLVRVIWLWAY